MSKTLPIVVLVLLAGAGVYWFSTRSSEGSERIPTTEETLARERAAAHFAGSDFEAARADLAPLIAGADALGGDLARAAAVEFMAGERIATEELLARLEKSDRDHPSLHYIRGRMAVGVGEYETALGHFRAVHALAPEDLPTMLSLANVLDDLDEDDEASELYENILGRGIEHGGAWYVSAAYRLSRIAVRSDPDEAKRLGELWGQLKERGFTAVTSAQLDRGTFGEVSPPSPRINEAPERTDEPTWSREPDLLPELAGSTELSLADVDGDRALDLIAAGPRGLRVALQDDPFTVEQISTDPVHLVRSLDLGDDDDLDLLVVAKDGTTVRLFERVDEAWIADRLSLPALPSFANDAQLVDYDHDGDLDVLFACDGGACLWRNDGAAEEGGAFVETTSEAGLPTGERYTWCTSEDWDSDQDADLILGGPGGYFLADSLRGGRFHDMTEGTLSVLPPSEREPLFADLDGDARTDVFVGADQGLWRQVGFGPELFERVEALGSAPGSDALFEIDIDLDGSVDVLWPGQSGLLEGWLAAGLDRRRSATLGTRGPNAPIAVALGDLDRDLDVDVVYATENGIEIYWCDGPVGNALGLQFLGLKDNRSGVGAVVELRAGSIYRRIYWRGGSQLAGIGTRKWADVVRVTWPNGTIQTDLDVEAGYQPLIDGEGFGVQEEGLVGSCPFLYTWNGNEFEFISDVLGITPLGLPMAPGKLVPPDHDEYVLVRGDQLVERNGSLELRFTEELREVTYLDRARLDVVDHPADVSIFPDERFCFPPFPPAHLHTVQGELAPTRVTGSGGRDWTQALAYADSEHAIPFEPLASQFLGLATPHWLELEFDPKDLAEANKLRLVLTGWFYWTDASVNVAAARTPGIDFVPPIFQVPGANGEWEAVGPPVGFPAGKTKSMVIDVSEYLDRDDPRLRIFSTLRLYWDRIALAVDDDDAPRKITSLEPSSAVLSYRGFSAPIIPAVVDGEPDDQPVRFDWEEVEHRPRWNPHPGQYTRYGETLPLLGEVDDRFIVMGAGDSLALSFDATTLPPIPDGWSRDYLVYLDGWAKDRDPNTVEALEVEPLPFHGMSSYPYGQDESFPDDPAHRAWRAEWQTRPSHDLILPLSPKREFEVFSAAYSKARETRGRSNRGRAVEAGDSTEPR